MVTETLSPPSDDSTPSEQAQASPSDAEIDAVFDALMACEPMITEDQLRQIDACAESEENRPTRRTGLFIARKGGQWFEKISKDEDAADALAQALSPLDSHITFLRGLADILEAAQVRLLVALCCHEGFDPETSTFRRTNNVRKLRA